MCFRQFSMQISAVITDKCIFSYSSVNITDNGTIMVSTLMFDYTEKTHHRVQKGTRINSRP